MLATHLTSDLPIAGAALGAYGFALWAAHELGDQFAQTHHQALEKGRRDAAGVLACLKHVLSYTAITAAFCALLWAFLPGLEITPAGFAAGQLLSAVTHYWADRRYTLAGLARRLGKEAYYELGKPRAGHDDNPTLGTGAFHLDQAWHKVWLFFAALAMTVI
ncbi:transcriptional regulator [Kribbella sp. NPDC020789]